MQHQNATEASQATLQIIREFHDAFNRHDVSAIMAAMTPDCIFENTYPPPDGERYTGSDAVRGFWERLFTESPNAHFAIEDIFACEDRGVIRWRYTWQTDGEPGGEANGDTGGDASGHIRGVDVFRVRDGKVAEKLSYVKG